MVLFNAIEMILQENNNTKVQLKEWYKHTSGQHFKRIISKELDTIKDIYQGRHTLFCGSSEYKKIIEKNNRGTFFSIDEDLLISSSNLSKNFRLRIIRMMLLFSHMDLSIHIIPTFLCARLIESRPMMP